MSRQSEGAFNDPAPGQDLEVPAVFGMLDDLDCPFADRGQRRAKLVARIASARGNMAQPDCGTAGLSQPKIRTASQRRPAILADFLHSDALFSLSCRIFSIRTGGTPKPRALKRSANLANVRKRAADAAEIWLALADRLERVEQRQRSRDRP